MPTRVLLVQWRAWIALITAIGFVVLVSSATMHHHATAAEDHECAICSVVAHKISGARLMALPKLLIVFVSYLPFVPETPGVARISLLLTPPSCGPPAPSSTIC